MGKRYYLVEGVGLLAPPKHDRAEHVPWVGPVPMRSKRKAGSVHSGGETIRQRAQAAGHAHKQRAQAVGHTHRQRAQAAAHTSSSPRLLAVHRGSAHRLQTHSPSAVRTACRPHAQAADSMQAT